MAVKILIALVGRLHQVFLIVYDSLRSIDSPRLIRMMMMMIMMMMSKNQGAPNLLKLIQNIRSGLIFFRYYALNLDLF